MNAHPVLDPILERPAADSEADAVLAWARCPEADPSHPYLAHSRLPRLMLRQLENYLVAPLSDLSEAVIGLRLVDPSGASDAWPKGAAHAPVIFGRLRGAIEVIIVGGKLADAMAIHVALGICVLHVPPEADARTVRHRLLTTNPEMKVLIARNSTAAFGPMGSAGHKLEDVIVSPPGVDWAPASARR